MHTKIRFSVITAIVLALIVSTVSIAQYAGYSAGTAYQLVNTSDAPVDITIQYYDSNGQLQTNATRVYNDVEANGSRLVIVPKDETSLGSGSFSAVVASSGPVAGLVNQEYYPIGNTTDPTTPFSSYSAAGEGGTTIFLPAIMYNYFNYYTEIFIQNVGAADTNDVKIEYIPGNVNGITTGTASQDPGNTIKLYATLKKSQQTMSQLGAPTGSGIFTGRFFGSAKITSSQPIAVVVNQHNLTQKKLMTYNGFISGATQVLSPTAMRGFFNYYTALTVANMSSSQATCVRLTYYPDLAQSQFLVRKDGTQNFTPVVAEFVVAPNAALLRYEGDDSSSSQSDLMATYTRFTGSVIIESFTGTVNNTACTQQSLAAIVNVEAKAGATFPTQAGSLNSIPVADATNTVIAPVILANYFGYYTTTVIANTTSTAATCAITYTSGAGSTVGAGVTKTYNRQLAANGTMFLYEGSPTNPDSRSDINADPFWKGGTSIGRFIGSSKIVCKDASNNPVPIVAFVNEEVNKNGSDSMYTFNTVNK